MRSATARRRRRPALVALALGIIASGLGCSDQSAIGPGAVVTVRIVPDTIRLVLGKMDTARAFPLDQAGGFVANKRARWASENPLVAAVDSNGVVTGMAIGMTQITATAGGVEGMAPVMVSPAPLIGLSTDSVQLTSVAQSGGAPSGTVTISNTGGATLDSIGLGTISYGGPATGWIAATLDQPTAPATLTVDVNTAGLAVGVYSATIPITAPSAPNSPQNVTVVLTLTPGAATTMAPSAGDNQTAQANAAVAVPPAVLVTDQFGNPVPGVAVNFAVATGGGSVTGGAAVTGTNGVAAVGSWQLGTTVGSNTLTATAAGLSGSPYTFTATAVAAAASQIAVDAGNGQTAVAGQTLSIPPSVVVRDAFGNPVGGVAVTFAVAGGGGSVTGPSQTTNASGIATVGSWTLGTTAGANSLTATATGLTGSPVSFTATGTPGPATAISISAGNNQSATAGSAVAVAPAVLVTDANGNGVPGIGVTFAVVSGGGSLTGPGPTTGANGVATIGSWQLGPTAGGNSLSATAAGVGSVTFTATGLTGPAAIIAVNAGDNQAATAGSAVPVPPSVRVTDVNGNPVSGIAVTFAVASGGGSLTGGSQSTNASGIATVGSWTLGTTAGGNTLTASSTGLSGSPVTFTATGNPGNASAIALNGGDGQTGTVGSALSTAVSVIVTDNNSNPVQGVTVGWATTSGGSLAPASSITDASGIATSSWTLGTTPGSQTATGSVGGLTGSPVTFTATAQVGAATQISKSAGDNQNATVNTAVAVAPTVLVTDQFGNPVSGVAVTFSVTGGGGAITGGSQTTNASGLAAVTSWTLGQTAGGNTLQAAAAGVGTVSFAATGTAGPATQIVVNAGNNQSATVNTAVAVDPSVVIRDQFNNPVSGVSVSFTPTAGGGGVTGSPQSSNASGIATVASWTLGTTAGTGNNTLQAAATGVGSVNFTASATADVPATLTINAGNGQTATVNTAVTIAPSVLVRDQFSNPVPSASVTFTPGAGSGGVSGSPASSNASGIATVGSWTLGTNSSTSMTLTASATGVSPVQFTATATPGPVASVSLSTGNSQTARPGTTLPINPRVRVRDSFGNDVCGATVTFAVTAGGGSATGTSTTASCSVVGFVGQALATVGSWTLGPGGASTAPAGGTYTNNLRATSNAVIFTFTATGRWSFATDVVGIFNNNSQSVNGGTCQGCHSLDFSVYTNVVGRNDVDDAGCSIGKIVVAGDTTNSLLYRKIQHTQPATGCGGSMPAIAGNPFLTAFERSVIRDWILNSAPNN